jgi:geranylgeranyl diphosphate synthase type I
MDGLVTLAPLQTSASTLLADVRGRVDRSLEDLFAAEQARWRAIDGSMADVVDNLRAFVLVGGKRLRPAFVQCGFLAAGGDDESEVSIRVATAMELLHSFALLHDDVMDGSTRRRGRPSYHELASAAHCEGNWRGEPRRFGEALAILVGDLAFVYADRMLGTQSSELRALWDEMRIELMMGQYLDVLGSARSDRDLGRAELVALYKSGRYTVERPLQLGAAAARPDHRLDRHFRNFGAPVGEAFQLRDDLLGAMGDEEVTGKPVGDDLREGKPTFLMACAHALATPAQLELFERVGRSDLTANDISAIQAALLECGAVAMVEQTIAVKMRAARTALDGAPFPEHARALLAELAELLAWRSR